MWCVSWFRLGIEWPEGGSNTNVSLGKEKETDEASSLQSYRYNVEPQSFSPCIYLHCSDRLLTLIEKHGLAPASSFIC